MRTNRLIPRIVSGALAALVALAVMPPAAPRAEEANKEAVEAYVEDIGDDHALLGEAVVLMGRMIQLSLRNPGQVETADYVGAIGRVEEILGRLGDASERAEDTESLNGERLREVNDLFVQTLASLEKTAEYMTVANYYYSDAAQAQWEQSRQGYLLFTESLDALKEAYGIAS